jgi:hypothetical protein
VIQKGKIAQNNGSNSSRKKGKSGEITERKKYNETGTCQKKKK